MCACSGHHEQSCLYWRRGCLHCGSLKWLSNQGLLSVIGTSCTELICKLKLRTDNLRAHCLSMNQPFALLLQFKLSFGWETCQSTCQCNFKESVYKISMLPCSKVCGPEVLSSCIILWLYDLWHIIPNSFF